MSYFVKTVYDKQEYVRSIFTYIGYLFEVCTEEKVFYDFK